MIDSFFRGLFDTDMTSVISIADFLLCIGVCLLIGLILAFGYLYRSQCSKSFLTTLAMGAGLIAGMGYLAFALLFTVVMCLLCLLYNRFGFGIERRAAAFKTLNITIPEDLDYTDVFEDIFESYASRWELIRVKTTNMGSLFRLTYNLTLKDPSKEKEMIDLLRCRNGNLEITVSRQETAAAEL